MNNQIIIAIEERLNIKNFKSAGTFLRYDTRVLDIIQSRLKNNIPHQNTLYEDITIFIKRLNNPRFIRKNKNIHDAEFYKYACIDDSTWSDIKNNKITPSKKTLLKIIIALKLNHQEAEEMLKKNGKNFDIRDIQDQIILAIIDLWDIYALDVRDVEEILFHYQEIYKDTKPFECIYHVN